MRAAEPTGATIVLFAVAVYLLSLLAPLAGRAVRR